MRRNRGIEDASKKFRIGSLALAIPSCVLSPLTAPTAVLLGIAGTFLPVNKDGYSMGLVGLIIGGLFFLWSFFGSIYFLIT